MNKPLQSRLATLGFSIVKLLSYLPLWIHYLFSDMMYLIAYRVVRYRRDVVRRNLTEAFPEKSSKEILKVERRFYHWFCDYIVETFKMASISEKEMRRRMTFKGLDDVNRLVAQGRSCGVLLGHYCNWEWISTLPLAVSPDAYCMELYHPIENPETDRFFLSLRERFGSICVPMERSVREIISHQKQGHPLVIGYIADQKPHWHSIHLWTDFLNHETPVLTGHERIIKKTNQAFFYLDVSRPKRGFYEAEFKLINENPSDVADFQLTETYFRLLEATIRRDPTLWLWSHDRWSRTRAEFEFRFRVRDGKVSSAASPEQWRAHLKELEEQKRRQESPSSVN